MAAWPSGGRRDAVRLTLPELHLVTSDAVLARSGFIDTAAALLHGGGTRLAVHVRGPATAGRQLWAASLALGGAAHAAGGRVVVNDRLDVALAAGAWGLQLGGRSVPGRRVRQLAGPTLRIGRSVHTVEEVVEAAADGSDYVLLGTIWASPSHPSMAPAGTGLVRAATRVADVPVIAIGGVTPERVAEVVLAGAKGVAVLSAVWNVRQPLDALRRFLDALDGAQGTEARP